MDGVNQQLEAVHQEIHEYRSTCGPDEGNAAREYSIALTALEDASMRFNRAQAMRAGLFHQFQDISV
jgi:hypothetical protein